MTFYYLIYILLSLSICKNILCLNMSFEVGEQFLTFFQEKGVIILCRYSHDCSQWHSMAVRGDIRDTSVVLSGGYDRLWL